MRLIKSVRNNSGILRKISEPDKGSVYKRESKRSRQILIDFNKQVIFKTRCVILKESDFMLKERI
jgi:hypothetical protein